MQNKKFKVSKRKFKHKSGVSKLRVVLTIPNKIIIQFVSDDDEKATKKINKILSQYGFKPIVIGYSEIMPEYKKAQPMSQNNNLFFDL